MASDKYPQRSEDISVMDISISQENKNVNKKTADDSTQGSPGFQSRTSANEKYIGIDRICQLKTKKERSKTGIVSGSDCKTALLPIPQVLLPIVVVYPILPDMSIKNRLKSIDII